MKWLKGAETHFYKLDQIGPCSKLLNEGLCILVTQGAAKIPEIKVGGTKKIETQTWCASGRAVEFFSDLLL